MAALASRLGVHVLVIAVASVASAADAVAQGSAAPGMRRTAVPQPVAASVPDVPPRLVLGVGGGVQGGVRPFQDTVTYELNREDASTRATYPAEGGGLFDASASVRVWRRLGAGVAVSRFTRSGMAETRSSLPHPLFLDRDRQVEGEAGGIRRDETAVHVQAQVLLPMRGPLQVVVMGGPSFVSVNQELVNRVNYAEEYPYDTATFTGAETGAGDGSALGFHMGADVRWMFSRVVGVGGSIRFSRAAVDITAGGRSVALDAGGVQGAAGLRIGF